MQEILDRLREIDGILCNRINLLAGHGETSLTSPALHSLYEAREGLWQARRALQIPENEPLQQLIEAIGRHPAAENDPSVIDAVNAVDDALRQKEAG